MCVGISNQHPYEKYGFDISLSGAYRDFISHQLKWLLKPRKINLSLLTGTSWLPTFCAPPWNSTQHHCLRGEFLSSRLSGLPSERVLKWVIEAELETAIFLICPMLMIIVPWPLRKRVWYFTSTQRNVLVILLIEKLSKFYISTFCWLCIQGDIGNSKGCSLFWGT